MQRNWDIRSRFCAVARFASRTIRGNISSGKMSA
jgi:hypothetical protein